MTNTGILMSRDRVKRDRIKETREKIRHLEVYISGVGGAVSAQTTDYLTKLKKELSELTENWVG